jgi:ABC-type nitrate/sulfonate/bicarbonate transport system ATPase subunit
MTMRLEIVRKIYPAQGDAPARVLFERLTLNLEDGEVCAVVGPSGVGKTSLLQIAAGLDQDFVGTVIGQPSSIGYVFQTSRLLPWRTARQNLELVLPDHPEKAGDWLAQVGLAGSEDVYPQRLSIGMARRVALARALAVRPKLLLLDEPFTALDKANARDMQDLVAEHLRALRPTTIIVTHHLQEAAGLADRVITLAGAPARVVADDQIAKSREAE